MRPPAGSADELAARRALARVPKLAAEYAHGKVQDLIALTDEAEARAQGLPDVAELAGMVQHLATMVENLASYVVDHEVRLGQLAKAHPELLWEERS